MVFQKHALYPHMTVYDNIGFALKLAKVPKEEIDTRVRKAAAILELEEGDLDRKPGQLSGGHSTSPALLALQRHSLPDFSKKSCFAS